MGCSGEYKKVGGQCGDCSTCGKCDRALNRTVAPKVAEVKKENPIMEQDNSTKLYTFLIYSENIAGLLSQISAVFTRRQVNIESLNVCASSTPGVHKYTITSFCDEEMAIMLTKQMEKKIDVLRANYYTDDQIFINETCLLKISSQVMLANSQVCSIVRQYAARIVEVNPTYATIEKTGITSDILDFFNALNAIQGCVLQFVRSGRIAITKSKVEHLDEYLAERELRRKEGRARQ